MIIYSSPTVGLTDVTATYGQNQSVALSESYPGLYSGDMPPGTPRGAYLLEIKEGTVVGGHCEYLWDGTQELSLLTAPSIDPTTLSRIDANAAIARKMATNKSVANPVAGTFITYDDNKTTPIHTAQTFNAAGQPSVVKPVRREPI